MAQTIQIKRSTGSAAPVTIAQGELAYSKGSETFYIGDPAAANTPIAIGPAIINDAGTASLVSGVTGAEVRSLIGAGTGQVDAITAGTGLTGSGTTTVTLNLDFTELTDMTGGVAGSTEIILNDAGTESRKAINEINLGQFNNDQGWTNNTGTLTGITAGSLIDVSGTTNITVNVDLSELTDMTAAVTGSDEMVLLDAGNQRRKALNEIDLSAFNNDAGFGSGTVTDQPAIIDSAGTPTFNAGITAGEVRTLLGLATSDNVEFEDVIVDGNLTVNGTTTTVNSETLTIDDNIIVLNNNVSGAPTENAGIEIERGTSDNVSIRFNETNDEWEFTNDGTSYSAIGASTGVDTIITNAGLDNSGSATVTLSLNLSELTDMTAAVNGAQDEMILLDNGNQRRKQLNEIALTAFNNDAGWTSNTGDITNVTAGVGLSGGGGSGSVSLALDFTELTDMTGGVAGTTELILNDAGTESRKAINEVNLGQFNNDQGWTANAGDITSIQISSTDGSITGTGTASSGAANFDLEVGTIDGGTY